MRRVIAPLITAIMICALMVPIVYADVAPKPTAEFTIHEEGRVIDDTPVYAVMLTCQPDESLYSPESFPGLNISDYDADMGCYWRPAPSAWGGNCTDGVCHFHYLVPDTFRLAVSTPETGDVYLSDEIERQHFHAQFTADITGDGRIELQDETPFLATSHGKNIVRFLIALFLTISIEIAIGFIYAIVIKKKDKKDILLAILYANIITLPIVWFIFPLMRIGALIIPAAELFAVVIEGLFIGWYIEEGIQRWKPYLLSLGLNAASFLIGGPLFLMYLFLTAYMIP